MSIRRLLVPIALLSVSLAACFPPVRELHPIAAKDMDCPESTIVASPVTLGSTKRMKVEGCGKKAVYFYDDTAKAWVKEPDPSTAAK